MEFKNFRLNIVVRIIFLVVIIGGFTYCLYHQLFLRSVYVAIALIFVLIELLRYVEKTNRDLISFLAALSQNDFTTTYAEKGKGKTFNQLYKTFNQITNKYRSISEEKEAQFIFLSLLVEHVRVGIISVDDKEQIHLINQSMRNYLSNTSAKNLADLHRDEVDLVKAFRTIKAGENQLVKKPVNGKIIPLTIHASEIRLQGQYFKLISVQDIRNELEANELEAWQKLIRVLTHEIMNSVSPIISLSATLHQLVNNHKKDQEPNIAEKATLQKGLEAIQLRSQGLQHFANNYRSLTKIPQPQFRKVKAASIIDRLTILFQEELGLKGITLKTDLNEGDIEILADPELIEQVLINLIRNAIDAVAEQSNPQIKIQVLNQQSKITVIQIEDNGSGIDEDKIDKVFIPFFTTKKSGSGIGLALSKQIIQMHGGQISIISHVGVGTTVEIRL
ncbi:MAG TPA: ATP-binding protein [Cyclobacteriaceae bacterium]|nr:ATP-binding protein [Cyclobacteriaceae bacterium]